jgi:hypothetical protein
MEAEMIIGGALMLMDFKLNMEEKRGPGMRLI